MESGSASREAGEEAVLASRGDAAPEADAGWRDAPGAESSAARSGFFSDGASGSTSMAGTSSYFDALVKMKSSQRDMHNRDGNETLAEKQRVEGEMEAQTTKLGKTMMIGGGYQNAKIQNPHANTRSN